MNHERGSTAQPHHPTADPGTGQRARIESTIWLKEPSDDACVLIVDDVDADVQLLQLILAMAGASSIHTITAAQATAGRSVPIRPDLVLVDVDVSQGGGLGLFSLLRHILEDEGFLPVIALTGDTTSGACQRALDAGANDVVTKPFDHLELVGRVENLLTMRALAQRVHRHNLVRQAEIDSVR